MRRVSFRLNTARSGSGMRLIIDGIELYPIGEALQQVGVSRATYFRWVRNGRVSDTKYKDRNGRRVFTSEEIEELKRVAHHLIPSQAQIEMPLKFG